MDIHTATKKLEQLEITTGQKIPYMGELIQAKTKLYNYSIGLNQ